MPDAAVAAHRPRRRPVARRLAPALAAAPAMLLLAPGAAHAAPPEQWADAPGVTSLQFLLVLVLVPGGLFVAIALLSLLPSMISGSHGYQPGGVWRTEAEWFGGPREGLERVDHDQPAALESSGERGGASGSW